MELSNFFDHLFTLGGDYAFYFRRRGEKPLFHANADRFSSASLIKVPILLAWAALERAGQVDLNEICDLDNEPEVKGAGFSHRMRTRRMPFHDVLLMMIATSDNLCTNLVIQRVGIERLNILFREELGLTGSELNRKLMDFAARERGLDNWISARDCIRLFDLVHALPEDQLAWVEPMLAHCQDSSLLMRNLDRDTIRFCHKTGSIEKVLHDWGYTRECDIFLLTQNFQEESAAVEAFGLAGALLKPQK